MRRTDHWDNLESLVGLKFKSVFFWKTLELVEEPKTLPRPSATWLTHNRLIRQEWSNCSTIYVAFPLTPRLDTRQLFPVEVQGIERCYMDWIGKKYQIWSGSKHSVNANWPGKWCFRATRPTALLWGPTQVVLNRTGKSPRTNRSVPVPATCWRADTAEKGLITAAARRKCLVYFCLIISA